MKVYIVISYYDYESEEIERVYLDYNKALSYLESRKEEEAKKSCGRKNIQILTQDVVE